MGRDPANNCEFKPCPGSFCLRSFLVVNLFLFSVKFCTEDLRRCPDGSFVGRDPNNKCRFKRCPRKSNPKALFFSSSLLPYFTASFRGGIAGIRCPAGKTCVVGPSSNKVTGMAIFGVGIISVGGLILFQRFLRNKNEDHDQDYEELSSHILQ